MGLLILFVIAFVVAALMLISKILNNIVKNDNKFNIVDIKKHCNEKENRTSIKDESKKGGRE